MHNVDWFQPFNHLSSFSVGGNYLVILNWLRTERFKRKNGILVDIIPNRKKELTGNDFIKPMVDELNEAWNIGFNVKSVLTNKVEVFHVALVGCDIPACRKIFGFLGKWFQIARMVSFCINLICDIFVSNRKTKCEKNKFNICVSWQSHEQQC